MRITSVLVVLAAATLLCSGCNSEPATTTTPATHGPKWIVDHVATADDPVTGGPVYTAYCARTETINPAHVPTDDELDPVSITDNEYRRLQSGDACPGRR